MPALCACSHREKSLKGEAIGNASVWAQKSGKAKFPCLLPAACNLLIRRVDHRWSVDRGGPGPLTTGSTLGRGISRDVWATHSNDPTQVLKVKWTHFARPPYSWANSLNLDWNDKVIFSIAHEYPIKDVMWKNVAFHPSQLKKNPFKQYKGYWVTQWLIIRPTFGCLSFEEGGKSQRTPFRLTIAFDECKISLKQLPLQSPSWLFRGWVAGMSSCGLVNGTHWEVLIDTGHG